MFKPNRHFFIFLVTIGLLSTSCTRAYVSKRAVPSAIPSSNAAASMSPSASPGGVAPFDGELLIADRGNNRLLVVNAAKKILWRYPSASAPPPPGGFYFPDDAFFTRHGHGIVSNQEENQTMVEISYPQGSLLWQYGHPHTIGSAPGYLHEPDDAYVLADGRVIVADDRNCRIVVLNKNHTFDHQLGKTGNCAHNPPKTFGSPNGDTPLANGNILISEINGHAIDEVTISGKLVWTVTLPVRYVSDPQQQGPDDYLVADYSRPGGIYEFNREGKILWSYHPPSGPQMLDHPSLAARLPNGFIGCNDDYRHRMVIIDPKSKRIVWQYGVTDKAGAGPGLLNIPDGFDLLAPDGTAPTHPYTG